MAQKFTPINFLGLHGSLVGLLQCGCTGAEGRYNVDAIQNAADALVYIYLQSYIVASGTPPLVA